MVEVGLSDLSVGKELRKECRMTSLVPSNPSEPLKHCLSLIPASIYQALIRHIPSHNILLLRKNRFKLPLFLIQNLFRSFHSYGSLLIILYIEIDKRSLMIRRL
jgi:hypothetical protein